MELHADGVLGEGVLSDVVMMTDIRNIDRIIMMMQEGVANVSIGCLDDDTCGYRSVVVGLGVLDGEPCDGDTWCIDGDGIGVISSINDSGARI